jgi:cyclic pyranopterin phosphate synthase
MREAAFRGLSHLTAGGDARMVDVSTKADTLREATARAVLRMRPATLAAIRAGQLQKGDALGVARAAGILAAKKTPDLIPLCHPLRITGVDLTFAFDDAASTLTVRARVRTTDKTGVEMEALTAAAIAALTVYDMVKAVEKGVTIAEIGLLEKSGGKSGRWVREVPPAASARLSASPRAKRSASEAAPVSASAAVGKRAPRARGR